MQNRGVLIGRALSPRIIACRQCGETETLGLCLCATRAKEVFRMRQRIAKKEAVSAIPCCLLTQHLAHWRGRFIILCPVVKIHLEQYDNTRNETLDRFDVGCPDPESTV